MGDPTTTTIARRHDLDALRSIAMLSGIALHAGLSFTSVPWPIQDSQKAEGLGFLFAFVHGFRMPLFFLISGYFTAMLWRKRGLKSLIWHRFRRIFLPFLLCLLTVIPASNYIVGWAITQRAEQTSSSRQATAETPTIWTSAGEGDLEAIQKFIDDGVEINQQEESFGVTPLSTAVMFGRIEAVQLLLENGADINMPVRDGSTPLHTAAFFGEYEIANYLLEHGADLSIQNSYGQTPTMSLTVDMGTTKLIAGMVNIEFDAEKIQAGRKKIAELFGHSEQTATDGGNGALNELYVSLFMQPVLQHLWFLWFLCWLVAGFSVYAIIADMLKLQGLPDWIMLSPLTYVWLIVLTLIPQWFMFESAFGPDTSAGMFPMPHMLLYYAIFFGFGALYFDAGDHAGILGRRYWITLPIAILVLFPVGLALAFGGTEVAGAIDERTMKLISSVVQVGYAWFMTLGCMGLFRKLLSRERKWLRYISDSSYWLYIVHLPLLFWMQAVVRDWPLPALVKFALLFVVTTGFLLLTYEYLVRYSWIGTLLNGKRTRGKKAVAQESN